MATNATWTVVLEDKLVIKQSGDGAGNAWEDANLGDFQDFITRWDTAHLAKLQSDWDNNNEFDDEKNPESSEDKIARLGARPTSYSS